MARSQVRSRSFPRTEPPPSYVSEIVDVFRKHEARIGTAPGKKGLRSNQVLRYLREALLALGFKVEGGATQKIERVLGGEDGVAALRYEMDAYHPAWRCGLEVEAARARLGNAIYRDLVQAMMMVEVDHLCVAVSNFYTFTVSGKPKESKDYQHTVAVATAFFGHARVRIPYGLTVIGY